MTAGAVPPGALRWGIPDAAMVWAGAAAAVGALAHVPVAGRDPGEMDPLYTFGVLLPAQQPGVLALLVMVSRWKGQGSLRADFGLEVRRSDAPALWLGPVLQLVLLVALLPLTWLGGEPEPQQLLQELQRSDDLLTIALFMVSAVIMAPVVEETLYRGLLLRGLLRRTTPGTAVFVSAVVFAAVHYLGDPHALRSLPALAALGVVLGTITVRTNSLSRPILIHAGFNLTTTLLVLAASAEHLA